MNKAISGAQLAGGRIRAMALAAGAAIIAPFAVTEAVAQSYPEQPVTIVVPYGPGGAVGSFGQMLADKLSQIWDEPVVVENRPGAAANIGSAHVSKADPDGYTILLAAEATFVTNEFVFSNMGFDPRNDLMPISRLADVNYALITSSRTGITDFDGFVEKMKAEGADFNYGSLGGGDASRLGMEQLKSEAELQDIVEIPYSGMADAMQGLLSGDHDMLMVSVRTSQQHIDSGAVVPLIISGGQRASALPDVPTFAEKGYPDIRVGFFLGTAVPAGTDPAIVEEIASALKQVMDMPDVRETYADKLGYEFVVSSPEEFATFLSEQRTRVGNLVERLGIEKQ